ncbi:MAG: hypothetical protein RI911_531 [Candidatus Parcubacteria bacterium]|jgi:adenylate cyclase class IV
MIEVEIRGELTKERYLELKMLCAKEGKHEGVLDRQMVLLKDVPGYSQNPNERLNDVRIRVTNGVCEIMIKKKMAENNVGRSEWSVSLPGQTLESAQQFVKALGCSNGQWMHRVKDEYVFDGAQWSLVEAVPGIYYFEIEKTAESASDVASVRDELMHIAHKQQLPVFSPEESKKFIEHLGETVNRHISW